PGLITSLREPGGPGVRVDGGVYAGWEVPIYYDPLLAKLAVWAPTRLEAIARLRRALAEYEVGGIRTTLPLFREITEQESFRDGAIDTGYLDRLLAARHAEVDGGPKLTPSRPPADPLVADLAIAAAALS